MIATLDDQVVALVAEGWRLVQSGKISPPGRLRTFADRAPDCNVSLIKSGDRLLDDEEQWAHLTRRAP